MTTTSETPPLTEAQRASLLAAPGKAASVYDFTIIRIAQVERVLNDATLDAAAVRADLDRRFPEAGKRVADVIKQHAELITFLPPDAVASPDEENEYEALAYELYAAIRELVSGR